MENEECDACKRTLSQAAINLNLTIASLHAMRPGQGNDVRDAIAACELALGRVVDAHTRITGSILSSAVKHRF